MASNIGLLFLLLDCFLVLRIIPNQIVRPQPQADGTSRDPAPIHKPPPAILDALQVDPLDHEAQRSGCTTATPNEERRPRPRGNSGSRQQGNLHDRQPGKNLLRLLVVLERNTLDAGLGIILDVLMGVDHVVQDRPSNITPV